MMTNCIIDSRRRGLTIYKQLCTLRHPYYIIITPIIVWITVDATVNHTYPKMISFNQNYTYKYIKYIHIIMLYIMYISILVQRIREIEWNLRSCFKLRSYSIISTRTYFLFARLYNQYSIMQVIISWLFLLLFLYFAK